MASFYMSLADASGYYFLPRLLGMHTTLPYIITTILLYINDVLTF